jgi:RNA polymerase-binding transcription factor DksA
MAELSGVGARRKLPHNQTINSEEGTMTKTSELERVNRQHGAITIERSSDPLGKIQAASPRTAEVRNLDREFVRDASAALHRLAEDNFGICPECDQDIHPKRFAAVPWAPFCLWCHEAPDRNRDDIQPLKRDLLGRTA